MTDNEQISSTSKPNQFGPYNPIRKAGQFYFISGQVGVDPITKIAPEGITEQTRLALNNLVSVLETVETDLNTVVKTTVFLTDMQDFDAMNATYMSFFHALRPARSAIAVKELPRVGGGVPLCVEIEAIAMIGGLNE